MSNFLFLVLVAGLIFLVIVTKRKLRVRKLPASHSEDYVVAYAAPQHPACAGKASYLYCLEAE